MVFRGRLSLIFFVSVLYCIILAGGTGTRLWPESTADRPKQFLKFQENRTMLTATTCRLAGLVAPERIFYATGQSFAPLIAESIPGISATQLLIEPAARNTAPCIGLAAVRILRDDPNATMVVLPADQAIKQEKLFCDTIRFAADLVEEDPNRLVTLGVKPTFPSESYGYIERSTPLSGPASDKWSSLTRAFSVEQFHEKPNGEKAKEFLASGRFCWNAGIFIWKARTILEQLRVFEPEIGTRLDTISQSVIQSDFPEILRREFCAMKKISIDYAVLEKSSNISVIEATFDWDDVGAWSALERINADKRDEQGNLADRGKLIAIRSGGNIVRSHDPNHVFAMLGVDNLIVVQTADATLIARKGQEEAVREVIEQISREG